MRLYGGTGNCTALQYRLYHACSAPVQLLHIDLWCRPKMHLVTSTILMNLTNTPRMFAAAARAMEPCLAVTINTNTADAHSNTGAGIPSRVCQMANRCQHVCVCVVLGACYPLGNNVLPDCNPCLLRIATQHVLGVKCAHPCGKSYLYRARATFPPATPIHKSPHDPCNAIEQYCRTVTAGKQLAHCLRWWCSQRPANTMRHELTRCHK